MHIAIWVGIIGFFILLWIAVWTAVVFGFLFIGESITEYLDILREANAQKQ